MAVPQLTLLPDPPLLTDDEDTYNIKADATVVAQQKSIPEINLALTWIGQQVSAADGYQQDAASSATAAAQSAAAALGAQTDMSAQIAQAAAYASNAKASATAAEAAPGSIGNLALIQATALLF